MNLSQAIESNNLNRVRELMTSQKTYYGSLSTYMGSFFQTPQAGLLQLAVKLHHYAIVCCLLENGYDINGTNPVLFIAIENNDVDMVSLLLEYNPDLTVKNTYGLLPLNVALGQECIEIVKLLIEYSAPLGTNDLAHPLYLVASKGNSELCELILSVEPNTEVIYDGHTPLCIASRSGNLSVVRTLLENMANPNFQDNRGQTPLHYAVNRIFRCELDEIKYLLDLLLVFGADKKITDHNGNTAEQLARERQLPLIADYIRDYVPAGIFTKAGVRK